MLDMVKFSHKVINFSKERLIINVSPVLKCSKVEQKEVETYEIILIFLEQTLTLTKDV